MAFDLNKARQHLGNFKFAELFIEELGWSRPVRRQAVPFEVKEEKFSRVPIAELSGVVVFEIPSEDGVIPDAKARAAVYKEVSARHHENVLIFVDRQRSQSLWYWAKRQDSRILPRDHIFMRGQPGDLFLSKLSGIHFDISDFDLDGNVSLVQVTGRLKEALDVERVTKRFYTEFQKQHIVFLELIEGIDDEHDRRWYASVLLNRLMFIYFLQRKLFLDKSDSNYLQNKLAFTQKNGKDLYYEKFLKVLFFEGFAKPEDRRSPQVNKLLGKIRYLNGGLFLFHSIEQRWAKIRIPDKAFQNLFALFERYSWNLDDTPGGQDNEINPDVLGYIFEKYINQKAFGAYYTRPEITEYLCERTIHALILDGVNTRGIPGAVPPRQFASIGDLLINLDVSLCRKLIYEVLPNLRLLDPACGSAAFLVAAMRTLINIYAAVIGKIRFLNDTGLSSWLSQVEKGHPSVNYYIKKMIITENLFGVDIMEEAVEIAKLRLFLALVAAANTVDDLEPLPNIDFNILPGNSLIGLMRVDDKDFENRTEDLFRKSYRQVLDEKNSLVRSYRHATSYAEDLSDLRDHIEQHKKEAYTTLNDILVGEFETLNIKYEETTWDQKKNAEGKPVKRAVSLADVEALKPFHWGFEFDEIINQHGGFDAIITNPPWEIFKPNGKEFLEQFSDLITRKKMTIKDFEKEQAKLLKDQDIREAWLEYLSEYPHVSEFFRSAKQFRNQISVVNGKKAGSDINLYKLFAEQCFNLLRSGGYCGIVIPSGIYTDLGTKQLREMLFGQTKVTGLFCIENRKEVFEGVHRSFKFVVLTFEKGNSTQSFPAAFMRHDVAELDRFPQEGAIDIDVDFVRRLSPDSLSVMEFKNEMDVQIVEKMLKFPLLGEDLPGKWAVQFTAEFHMTNDSYLFKTESGKGRLPLYEGKMIWQFNHRLAEPKYWVDEKVARKALFGRDEDCGQRLDYQSYRVGLRAVASNTNERSLISSVVPSNVFCGNSLLVSLGQTMTPPEALFLTTVMNSFVMDSLLRNKVTTNINMFFIYQLPVPRMTGDDSVFNSIVQRAAQLICTASEFDDLAKQVGLKSHKDGATDLVERAKLRAELDALIAHLYCLTEDEFTHILKTFPIVPEPVRAAAFDAYRDVGNGKVK